MPGRGDGKVRETRYVTSPLEVREDAQTATIAGHASTFGEPYELWPGISEQVSRGAFRKTLKENRDNIAVVFNHDPARVLATMASKTARFAEDEHGLRYEADLDLTDPEALAAYRKIERGLISRSSFSFEVVKEEIDYDSDPILRDLKEVRLWEASPVLWPANPGTDVDVARCLRGVAEALDTDLQALTEAVKAGELPRLLSTRHDATPEPPAPEPDIHSGGTPEPEPPRKIRHLFPL